MREKEGLDSILEEEAFERKLQMLSKLPPQHKKRRLSSLNYAEKARAFDHRITNISIENSRQFESEWRRENPDGEYQET